MSTDHQIRARLIARLKEMTANLAEVDRQLEDPAVLSDHTRVRSLSIKKSVLAPVCEQFEQYRAIEREIEELRPVTDGGADEDPEYLQLVRDELAALQDQADTLFEAIKTGLVTSEDEAIGSVIMELRAGVGGDEAGLWVADLLEMYRKFAALRRWKVEDLDFSPGDLGGFRSAVLSISGERVWAHLGYEGGTHQVKRVPVTEAQGRIHTSTATVAVLPEPKEVELDLDEDDVQVHITTSQGPGGQNVNKVATAVHLIHEPTGIEVRMQDSKSQQQNRERAWKLLRARLYERKRAEIDRERAEQRVAMIGSASRAEKIRTYRWKEGIVVDHRIGQTFNLQAILEGRLDDLVDALVRFDTAKRLAAI